MVKVVFPASLVKILFSFHDNESSTQQLINGISNDLQKLLKYFSGTAIFALFLSVIKLDLYMMMNYLKYDYQQLDQHFVLFCVF